MGDMYSLVVLWLTFLASCCLSPPLPPSSLTFNSSPLPATIGAEINRMKKNFTESQGRRNNQLRGLGDELQGVQKIMYENIDAVLQRGELVSGKELLYHGLMYWFGMHSVGPAILCLRQIIGMHK